MRELLVADQPLPLIMTTLFPIGDAYITIDRETGKSLTKDFTGPFHRPRTQSIRTAFDERFADISGVIWSRVGSATSRVEAPADLSQPLMQVPLATSWGVWDRELSSPRGRVGGQRHPMPQRRHHDDVPECPLAPSVP